MKLHYSLITSISVFLFFWFIGLILNYLINGPEGAAQSASFISAPVILGGLLGVLSWFLSKIFRKLNKGVLFALIYFFFTFPWPMQLGGTYHPWWHYVSSFFQIIIGGFMFFYLHRYLTSLVFKKENTGKTQPLHLQGPGDKTPPGL